MDTEATPGAPYCKTLASAGFRILIAGSGERAMQICAERAASIDLVICRVILDAMTGPELAQELKSVCQAPVLLVSKYPRDVIHSVRGFSFSLEILEDPSAEELVERARKALRRGKRT